MRLTIGLPTFDNYTETWFTIQALRIYHCLVDCEILVVDNFGDPNLEKFIKTQCSDIARYIKYTEKVGPSCAKNKVFEHARGEMVLCADSHILFKPGALDNIPVTDDLIQGPLMYCDTKNYSCQWKPQWRGNMWGIWGDYMQTLPKEPFEIWGMGAGVLLAKRTSWLGYNPRFSGFGGEEGYIHEKYRKAGRKVWCYPNLIWMHLFHDQGRPIKYPCRLVDRVRNYLIGFEELGLDTTEMEKHFGESLIKQAKSIIDNDLKPVAKAPIVPNINTNKLKMISALCITYGRPHLLEEAIESFLRQDYPNKEMIILNDLAEQTLVFNHPQVKIFNFKERFKSIGEKRNKCVELSHGDILTNWDDDDISLPWRLSQIVRTFNIYPDIGYFKPYKAWCYYGNQLKKPECNMFYMMASFTRKAFLEIGGYNSSNFGEDTEFCERLINHLTLNKAKTLEFLDREYAFIYGWRGDSFHLSALSSKEESGTNLNKAERFIKAKPIEAVVNLKPHWREDYLSMTRNILK